MNKHIGKLQKNKVEIFILPSIKIRDFIKTKSKIKKIVTAL